MTVFMLFKGEGYQILTHIFIQINIIFGEGVNSVVKTCVMCVNTGITKAVLLSASK